MRPPITGTEDFSFKHVLAQSGNAQRSKQLSVFGMFRSNRFVFKYVVSLRNKDKDTDVFFYDDFAGAMTKYNKIDA